MWWLCISQEASTVPDTLYMAVPFAFRLDSGVKVENGTMGRRRGSRQRKSFEIIMTPDLSTPHTM